jgi:hypothetical protein
MTNDQAKRLAPGLYHLYWTDGGSSVASVGQHWDGEPWYMPLNWITMPTRIDWSIVGDAVLIEKQNHQRPAPYGFLLALVEDPTDVAALSAFCDWLSEQSIPNASVRSLLVMPGDTVVATMRSDFDVPALLARLHERFPNNLVIMTTEELALEVLRDT